MVDATDLIGLEVQASSNDPARRRIDLADVLEWIDALRARFGDPAVDSTPWRGNDLRL